MHGALDFSHLHNNETGSGAHPAFCSVGAGVKWPGRYIDRLPLPSAEVKDE
jgi:hypothetical protein